MEYTVARPTGNDDRLPWQPFTRQSLKTATASDATVLVDFTADWLSDVQDFGSNGSQHAGNLRGRVRRESCWSCADWTHAQPEVTQMLELLGSKQVPVLAIFPAANPESPHRLARRLDWRNAARCVHKAGPSKTP